MASLFENAVASIRMGVEDFRQQDADRDISAVRNFYAGVLLLAKEALIRAAPNADPMLVIGAKLKPVADGNGGIAMEQVGHSTIDFQQVSVRAKDFGVSIDHKALKALNELRNDLEHHYTDESSTAIRAAISKGFPVAASLFRQMEEDPLALLGEVWTTMLETKELYEQELASARATYEKVEWFSPTLDGTALKCTECKSELVEQIDAENELQTLVELRCRTCGTLPDIEAVIEQAVGDVHGGESYVRHKETGEEGPIYTCPACHRDTLVEGEDGCANCNESVDFEDECTRCGNGITLQDYLDGLDSGLCSYCSWQADKWARED